MLRMPYAIRISTLPLTILEMSGVVLKGNILKVLCEGLRVTLQELLICGSLCNSPDFDEYITAIGEWKFIHLRDAKNNSFKTFKEYENFIHKLLDTLKHIMRFEEDHKRLKKTPTIISDKILREEEGGSERERGNS